MALRGIKRAKSKATYRVKKTVKELLREKHPVPKYYVKSAPKQDPQLIKAYQRLKYHWGVFSFSKAQAIRGIAKDLQVGGIAATKLWNKLYRQGCFRKTTTTWPV